MRREPAAMGCSQVVRHGTLTPAFAGSSPATPAKHDPLAQLAEHLTFNQGVWSSNLQWVIPICLLISPLVRAWRNGRRARLRIWCLWRKSSSLFARTNSLRTMQSRGYAVVAQLVERHLAKVEVASPSLVYRSTCGCSSMVELQPSKLVTWVRFPSPAPAQRVLFMSSPQETVRKGGFFFYLPCLLIWKQLVCLSSSQAPAQIAA